MAVFCYVAKGVKYWGVDTWKEGKRIRLRGLATKEDAVIALSGESHLAKPRAIRGGFARVPEVEQPRVKKMTVEGAWDLYGPISKRDVDSWEEDWSRSKHLLRLLGERNIESLTLLDIDQYRTQRLTEKTKYRRAPSKATLDHELKLLKRIINYAIRCGLVAGNPIAGVKNLLRPNDNARKVLMPDDVFNHIVAHAVPHLQPILVLLRDTGMRRGEVLGLSWDQVDLERGTIRLGHQDTKTNAGRIVPLTERCVCALGGLDGGGRWVFQNPQTGKPWRNLRASFILACKGAGVEPGINGFVLHDLRRAAITEMRRAGVSEIVTMRISGHKTRSVFERYNIVGEDDLTAAVEKVTARRAMTRGVGQGLVKVN
ncbi:MAG: tyrosine-type recombinase/integrase [Deltaproteobacteria bacterium]|nr:tyrosine-type recombinase/integrase [Deltaproteobacteria bacterium]